jgi:epoxyqueuosine reductase
MKEVIRQRAFELGFDECRLTTAEPPETARHFERWLVENREGEMGYLRKNAQKRVEPQGVLNGAKSVLCLAVSYRGAKTSDVKHQTSNIPSRDAPHETPGSCPQGQIASYARYADYHKIIGENLKSLTTFINQTGGKETKSLWYVDTGPVLERDLAQRAGLGFIGKHTNLIGRKLGNWIFLAEILTTLELEPDLPETNRCGTCERCIKACPTGAITAPFQLDARLCISYLTIELKGSIPLELRSSIGNRIYGCDDCLAACPWNRFARDGAMMKEHARRDFETPDLVELLDLDEAGFKRKFSGTPMLRTKRRGLLRNVCVALGNVGDEAALSTLREAAGDPEPLIAEHARWAIEQIEKRSRHQELGGPRPG